MKCKAPFSIFARGVAEHVRSLAANLKIGFERASMKVDAISNKLWAIKGLVASRIYRVGRNVVASIRGKANPISVLASRLKLWRPSQNKSMNATAKTIVKTIYVGGQARLHVRQQVEVGNFTQAVCMEVFYFHPQRRTAGHYYATGLR